MPGIARCHQEWFCFTAIRGLFLVGGLLMNAPRLLAADGLTPESPEVKRAIARGQDALKRLELPAGGYCSLVGYALVKSEVPVESAVVQRILFGVLKKYSENEYKAATINEEQIYEATMDAMLLEAIDPEKYRPQLEISARFLSEQLRDYNLWQYSHLPTQAIIADISVTQYAILGLWACYRAGVEISPEIWDRAARGLLACQRADGGFAYRPNDLTTPSTFTMTPAGASSLLVLQSIIDPNGRPGNLRGLNTRRKHGVLEALNDEPVGRKPNRAVAANPVAPGAIQIGINKAMEWITQRYFLHREWATFRGYYYAYTLERLAALQGTDELFGHQWYNDGARHLLRLQRDDGSWETSDATAFSVLFLSKATAKIVGDRPQVKKIGGGLLAGGRGLPGNLAQVQAANGEIKTRKLVGSLDAFLNELEKPQMEANLVPDTVPLESLQIADPESLIKQRDRVLKLLKDPRPEARRLGIWAVGQMEDLHLAARLIDALSDDDVGILQETSLALCSLTRKPAGLNGVPIDPLEGLAEGANDAVRAAHLKSWKEKTLAGWKAWHLQHRPYDERDDRRQLPPALPLAR